MNSTDALQIDASLSIPMLELDVTLSRSGGPGGQHVNKTESRVQISWAPATSRLASQLTAEAREQFLAALSSRMTGDGRILVTAQESRSQLLNRESALEKLAGIVRRALFVPKKRTQSRPSRAAKRRRLENKRRDSEKKKNRRWQGD